MKRILLSHDIADRLGISLGTLRNRRDKGLWHLLPPGKCIGGRWVYDADEFERWWAAQPTRSKSKPAPKPRAKPNRKSVPQGFVRVTNADYATEMLTEYVPAFVLGPIAQAVMLAVSTTMADAPERTADRPGEDRKS